MHRLLILVALIVVPPLAHRDAAPACGAGTSVYVDGPLRIFAAHGTEHACVRGGAKPVAIRGTAVSYLFAGGRYLAATTIRADARGEHPARVVYDLRRGTVVQRDRGFGDDVRLTARGELVAAPAGATDVALGDGTLYWTRDGAAHRWSLRPPEPPGRSPGAS